MVRLERLRRFAKGDNRDYTPMPLKKISPRLSETFDKLASIAKGDKRDLVSKVQIKLLGLLREILDRWRRLPIKFKRDFNSVSSIFNLLRFTQTL